jgi:choline dehydrogenase-like flavoprotein
MNALNIFQWLFNPLIRTWANPLTETMPENSSFDAIVIGSGISGGWAAKELCEKGLKTLLLERGRPLQHVQDYTTAPLDPWQFPHGGNLTPEEKKKHHVQVRHYSIREDNKQFYINDLENPYVETSRYDWVRADVLGGRSLLWARMTFRWSDLDFEANARDGVGIDWPIRYKEIAPWYDYVEKFTGISGSRENIRQLPDGIFQAPMELNCVEKDLKQKMEARYPERKLIIGRVANLTAGLPGRGTCQYRNLCHRGCPYGAYFSTLSATLPAARKTGKLTVRTDAIANRILVDDDTGRATGVEIIDRKTLKTEVFHARIVFCNASTLGTTFLLLNSDSKRFPQGIGNDHDLVGRFLMDHHKTGMSADIEGFEDTYYFGRRPTGVYIPRFKNMGDEKLDFLRAYNYQGGAYRTRGAGASGVGAEFKEALTEAGPWRVGFTAFGECLPYAENRVTLSREKQDIYGRPVLAINASFRENEIRMQQDEIRTMEEMMQSLGAKNFQSANNMSFPGNANHEMGTARMGRDPKTSVLNKWNQVHTVKNLFITDGSCMASCSSVNPSLTYMALTARAVDHAVSELKKRNI